jgi:hypothetical protein
MTLSDNVRRGAPIAVLALVGAAVLHSALLTPNVLFERDFNNLWYPRVSSLVRAVGEGAWPIWDPFPGFGHSVAADPSYQLFYPLTWLNLLIPPPVFLKLFALAHVIWTSLGMWRLLRRLGLSETAAVTAGAAWSTCGPFLSLVGLYHHMTSMAWTPWVLFALLRLLDSATWRAAVALGAVAGVQLLGGSADMCAFTAWLAPVVVLVAPGSLARLTDGRGRRLAMLLAAAGVLASALAAAQWLPTAMQLQGSNRAAYESRINLGWSLHPLSLVDAVAPMVVADAPLRVTWRAAVSESREPLLHSLYLGAATAPLVLLGLVACRRRQQLVLGGGLLWCLAAALGRNAVLYPVLLKLPLVGVFRYPAKWVAPGAFLWAIALAYGLDAVAANNQKTRRPRLGLGFGVALALAGVLATLAWAVDSGRCSSLLAEDVVGAVRAEVQQRATLALSIAAAVALTVSGMLAGRWRWPARSQRWTLALSVVVLLDLVRAGGPVNRLAPRELLAYRPTLLAHIDPDTATYRVFSAAYADSGPQVLRVPKGWSGAAAWALGQIDVVRPMIHGRFRLYGSFDGDPTGLLDQPVVAMAGKAHEGLDPGTFLRLLRLANVRYVVGLEDDRLSFLSRVACWDSVPAKPVCVWEASGALPRAYVVDRARLVQGSSGVDVLSDRTFDASREILVDQPWAVSGGRPGFDATARVLGRRADRVELETKTNGAGFLVLLDGYDRGWRGFVDGRAVSVLRANLLFRAVPIPTGAHRVVLVYRPPALLWGLAASGLGLIVVLVSVFWAGRGRARKGGSL